MTEGWYAVVDGEKVSIPKGLVKRPQPAKPDAGTPTGTADPLLLNLAQSTECFVFNKEQLAIATYEWAWNGTKKTKILKYGTEKYGYKHIKKEHEKNGQKKLNELKAKGQGQGYAWDDVMASGIWAAMSFSDFASYKVTENKYCSVGRLGYYATKV